MDEVLDEATLPRKYVTMSTCFRREAGTYGKDTTGLYRIHQFDKVEQVVICTADKVNPACGITRCSHSLGRCWSG